MKLIMESWDKFLTEDEVRDVFAEHGFVLSEEMLQEIDWKNAKKLINRGVAGLALIAALTGVATPALGNEPPDSGSCSEAECAVDVNVDEDAMKLDLAKLINALLGGSEPTEEQLKDAYEMTGWQLEWGSYKDYLKK
jgi:propanediol dehydratase large subunit